MHDGDVHVNLQVDVFSLPGRSAGRSTGQRET
jgi:hypothetical protein